MRHVTLQVRMVIAYDNAGLPDPDRDVWIEDVVGETDLSDAEILKAANEKHPRAFGIRAIVKSPV